jgi:hypothetical protein
MARMRRLWVPVPVGLLVAALIGPGGIAGAEPRVTVAKAIMIPAAAFIASSDGWEYTNNGVSLSTDVGWGAFSAPLSFPVPVVNIKRVTAYIFDNDSSGQICVRLYRTRPVDGQEDYAAQVCSTDLTADPAAAYTTVISPRRVTTAFQGVYLWVQLFGPNVKLYGVKVTYSYETGA